MRTPTRDEWWWLVGGAAPLSAFAIYALVIGLLGPPAYFTMALMAVFYGIVWWTSTRGTGRLRFRLSVPFFLVGTISIVVIPSFTPQTMPLLLALVSAFLASSVGVGLIAEYDFPRIKVGKKTSPVLSKADRMLRLGILLWVGGWFIVLADGLFLSSIEAAFQESSPASLIGKTCFTLGVIFVSVAVVIARRNYVSG